MDLITQIANIAKFNYTLSLAPDGRHGPGSADKPIGLIGELYYGVRNCLTLFQICTHFKLL